MTFISRTAVALVLLHVLSPAALFAQQVLPFRIVGREEQEKGGSRYLLVVAKAALTDKSPNLTKPNVDTTLRNLLRMVRDEARKRGKTIDGVTVLLYQSVEHANGANAAIGRAEWWPKGHSFAVGNAANIQNKASYVETFEILSLPTPPKASTANGLSEPVRRQIFTALVKSQDRARREAEARFPTDASKIPMAQLRNYDSTTALAQNSKYNDTLRKKYELELLREFKISKATLEAITSEAFAQQWPLPPSR